MGFVIVSAGRRLATRGGGGGGGGGSPQETPGVDVDAHSLPVWEW